MARTENEIYYEEDMAELQHWHWTGRTHHLGVTWRRYVIEWAEAPRRSMVSQLDSGWNDDQGWVRRLEFQASATPAEGMLRFTVEEADEPHRCLVRQQDGWSGQGWSPRCEFWSFGQAKADAVRIEVFEAREPHRAVAEAQPMQPGWGQAIQPRTLVDPDAGWEPSLCFHARPCG